jgi:hydrogenase-4 transcriptional activator
VNRSTGLLRAYTTLIRHVSGADSACLFLPSIGERDPLLLLEGDHPVPELVDLETARRFTSSHVEAAGDRLQKAESSCPNGWLVGVTYGSTTSGSSAGRRRFEDQTDELPPIRCWLGLRFQDDDRGRDQSANAFRLLVRGDSQSGPSERPEAWTSLLDLGGVLAWYAGQISAILDDPVTGLAGRAEFQASLSHAMEAAREIGRPLSLLLVNPDDFTSVNESQGHDAGDQVLREIGARLRAAHRMSDTIAKYGGAIFASFVTDTDLAATRIVAEKVWATLSETPYLDRSVRLGISVGFAVFDPKEDDVDGHLELIRRADKALNAAKRFGGDHVVAWEPRLDDEALGNVDRLTGIYTGNMAKDYRNMTLLSDTMTVVAGSANVEQLAERVVEQLYTTLTADRVGIFELDRDEISLIKGLTKKARPSGGHQPIAELELGRRQQALVDDTRRDHRAVHASFTDDFSEQEVLTFAIPIVLGEKALGCLYLDGRADTFALEGPSDLAFFRAFATQLAVAIDRARLREQQQRHSESERQRLRAEVDDLRASLRQSKLVYRSRAMDGVIGTVRRVAPTNATVLVIGESGTGKELVARTIHDLSPFRKKPLVVVDCGAIPTTLIESELFGHERGAYTGAQERRIGRLLEAEGGTLVLDEIGELPLEVQSKLLRFVQERQITPVGGTRARRVEARLVAVTNRELAVEAAAGRFREDLYYRLNVVRITVPPLRERPEDIVHLAEYFLDHYARQYQKGELSFDDAARAQMVDHDWPGNVRELQNRIMQAVILAEDAVIGIPELELQRSSTGRTVEMDLSMVGPGSVKVARSLAASPVSSTEFDVPLEQLWEALRSALGSQVQAVLTTPNAAPVPLGTWLMEDLVLHAYETSGGVSGRARARLGIPETTFRRRLQKASSKVRAELLTRKPEWSALKPIITALVRSDAGTYGDVLQRARGTLLEEVTSQTDDAVVGAALMGVTVGTYRRWTTASALEKASLVSAG